MLSPDVGFDEPGYGAVTRFEPVEARAAFPCWDEPAPKATWSMTMISRNGTVNLANVSRFYPYVCASIADQA
jgi:aminopeptidase N